MMEDDLSNDEPQVVDTHGLTMEEYILGTVFTEDGPTLEDYIMGDVVLGDDENLEKRIIEEENVQEKALSIVNMDVSKIKEENVSDGEDNAGDNNEEKLWTEESRETQAISVLYEVHSENPEKNCNDQEYFANNSLIAVSEAQNIAGYPIELEEQHVMDKTTIQTNNILPNDKESTRDEYIIPDFEEDIDDPNDPDFIPDDVDSIPDELDNLGDSVDSEFAQNDPDYIPNNKNVVPNDADELDDPDDPGIPEFILNNPDISPDDPDFIADDEDTISDAKYFTKPSALTEKNFAGLLSQTREKKSKKHKNKEQKCKKVVVNKSKDTREEKPPAKSIKEEISVTIEKKCRTKACKRPERKRPPGVPKVKFPREHRVKFVTLDLTYECKVCERKFKHAGNLAQHMESHKSKEEKGKVEPEYSCNICNKKYGKERYLSSHMKNKHPTGETTIKSEKVSYNIGPIAKKKPSTVSLRVEHENKIYHLDTQRYECKYCPETFIKVSDFVLHVNKHETMGCPHCPMRFKTNDALKKHKASHLKRVNGSNKKRIVVSSLICKICGVFRDHKALLDRHMETMHPQEETDKKLNLDIIFHKT